MWRAVVFWSSHEISHLNEFVVRFGSYPASRDTGPMKREPFLLVLKGGLKKSNNAIKAKSKDSREP